MRSSWWGLGLVGAVALSAATPELGAQQVARQTVSFRVSAISRVAVASPSAPLTIRAATPSAASGSYALTTNESNRKIAASLDRALPTGMSLAVNVAAPSGGTSAGRTPLGMVATDVVTGIPAGEAGTQSIEYSLQSAAPAARGGDARIVTYTIVAGQ